MAQKTVRVLRAFNGINKDQESAEKSRYFTQGNADTAEDFLSEKEFQYRQDEGFISVDIVPDPEPLVFETPAERQAVVTETTTGTPARRRRTVGSEE